MTCTEEYREHSEYTSHAFCKAVIRNAGHTALRTGCRKHKREISLDYPAHAKRMFEEWDVDVRTEPGDEMVWAEGKVDFLSFRYDRSMVSTADAGYEVTCRNLLSGKKNPYLQTSEWGWQIGPVGLRVSRNEM